MDVRHISSVFDFLVLPIRLLLIAIFRPRQLSEISRGERGVVYSLVAAFWTVVVRNLLEKYFAEELGYTATAEALDSILSTPFAFEILTIPKLLFFLLVFWIPGFLFFRDPEERVDMISLSLILFFLASLPILVLSRTPFYPEELVFEEASWRELLQGNAGVWVFLMVPVLIGLFLYPLNARRLAPRHPAWLLALYFVAAVMIVVTFAWEVEPIVDAVSLSIFYHAVTCESFDCFQENVIGIVRFVFG